MKFTLRKARSQKNNYANSNNKKENHNKHKSQINIS